MTTTDDIEKFIKKTGLETKTEMNEVVRNRIFQAFEKSKQTKSALTGSNIWRIIMKSPITKLAAAVVLIGALGSYLFFGSNQTTLYAQVMEAFEQAKTIYAVGYTFEDNQMKKAIELWYQEGVGLRTEEIRDGKSLTRLDNGNYEWEYLEGNDFAVQTASRRKMHLPGEITEPSRYLKKSIREPEGDIEVDGSACKLYIHIHPGDDGQSAVRSMMWIDEQMRFRQYEESKFADGVWRKIESATLSYDIPIKSELFATDFGLKIEIIKPQDLIKNLFPIEDAVATKEVMGLIFAVHELKRNGSYIFTTCSIRPTEELRDRLRNYNPLDNKKDFEHYGDIYLTSWWERKKNGDLMERPYTHTILGYYQVEDILIRCFASLPKAEWPGVNDEFELSVGISSMGKLRELLIEEGQSRNTQEFRPLFSLPLPAEDTECDEIAANLYERAMLVAPLKPTRLEPIPSEITNEEFAIKIEKKLIGLRPMEDLWQSTGSEVTVILVDEKSQPIQGAKIGSDIRSYDGRLYWYSQNGRRDCAVSDSDGKVILKGSQMFAPNASRQSSCMLFALHKEQQKAGLVPITDEDFGSTISLTMHSACRIYGRFVCPELSNNAEALNNTVKTHLSFFGEKMIYRVLYHITDKQVFEALLVPGKYEMVSESHDAKGRWIARTGQLLDVPKDEKELDLGEIVLRLEDYK